MRSVTFVQALEEMRYSVVQHCPQLIALKRRMISLKSKMQAPNEVGYSREARVRKARSARAARLKTCGKIVGSYFAGDLLLS